MPAPASHPIKPSWFIWTALALTLFVLIGFYSVNKAENYTGYDEQRSEARYATLQKMRADEAAVLTNADWVDQGKKIVRIPIDEAMMEEVGILKAKPPVMGGVIPVINAAAAAPASSSTNAVMNTNAAPAKPTP